MLARSRRLLTAAVPGLALAWLAVAAPGAHAQTAEAPVRRVGDTWARSHGLVITVVRADERGSVERGHVRQCPTCLSHFDRDGNYTGVVTDAAGAPVDAAAFPGILVGPGWRFFEWPLELGKTWLFSGQGYVPGAAVRVFVTASVRQIEDVETVGGTFRAFKLRYDWERRGEVGERLAWSTTSWYAPAARHVVKFTTTSPTGEEWELVSVRLRP